MRKTIAGFLLRLARRLWPASVAESDEYVALARSQSETIARLETALAAEKTAAARALETMRCECDRIKGDYDIERERLEKMLEKARADCGVLSSGLLSRAVELQSIREQLASLGIRDAFKTLA
jgi:hypothetical protein